MEEINQIIIYQTADNQTQIDVRMENDTVWLTQEYSIFSKKHVRMFFSRHSDVYILWIA